MRVREFRNWGRVWLEGMEITAGLGILIYLLVGVDLGFRGQENMWGSILSLLAWYLLICGAFVSFVLLVNSFLQYVPLVLTLGSTRRGAVAGALLMGAGSSLTVLAAAALLWRFAGDDIAQSGLRILGALAGIQLAVDGVAVLFAILALRCKRAALVLGVMGMVIGAAAGLSFYLFSSGKMAGRISWLAESLAGNGNPLLNAGLAAAGAAVYLLMAGVAFAFTRKLEARL